MKKKELEKEKQQAKSSRIELTTDDINIDSYVSMKRNAPSPRITSSESTPTPTANREVPEEPLLHYVQLQTQLEEELAQAKRKIAEVICRNIC